MSDAAESEITVSHQITQICIRNGIAIADYLTTDAGSLWNAGVFMVDLGNHIRTGSYHARACAKRMGPMGR